MINELRITAVFLLLSLLIMSWQCDGVEPDELFTYQFVDKVNLSPVRKSYKLGDTLWVKYENNDRRLYDVLSKQNILTDSVSIGFWISYTTTYYSAYSPLGGHSEFVTSDKNITVERINRGEGGASIHMNFGCSNNQSFKLGIILKMKGIYKLNMYNYSNSNKSRVVSCENTKSPFPNSTIEYRFGVFDGNKDVYQSIPYISRGESPKGHTESLIDKKHVFIVKVE